MSAGRRGKFSGAVQKPWVSFLPNESHTSVQDYSHVSAPADIISSTPSVAKMMPPNLNVSVIPRTTTRGHRLDLSQNAEHCKGRSKLLSADASVECLQNRAVQWKYLELLAAKRFQAYKHSAECQISALWKEMDAQRKHVTQLQLAVEEAQAEQFKEELMQTQERSLEQIVEELTACKVEHEKLALAIDSSRHQLLVSGVDITSEGELVRELQACKCLIEDVTSLTPSWKGSEVVGLESTITQLGNAVLQEQDTAMLLREKVNTMLDQETEGLSLCFN